MLNECFNRHILLKGFLATTAVAALGGSFGVRSAAAAEGGSTLTFAELDRVRDAADHWPEGYDRQVLLRWGDAMFPDSPEFDLATIDGPGAERQFGYSYDFTAFLPLPLGSTASDRGLLLVSHEYASPFLMFPGFSMANYRDKLTDAQIRTVMASTGVSIVEIKRQGKQWEVVRDGEYNRRIHMGTEMVISGPAAGDDRLKTKADPSGTVVFGTISNCNGGVTPWGTMLSGEEGRWMCLPATTPRWTTRNWSSARAGMKVRMISMPSRASSRASTLPMNPMNG